MKFLGGNGRRFWSILLSIALLITTIPMGVVTVNAATTEFAGGNGSVYNPYIIETKEQLNNIRNYPSSSFKLNNNLAFTAQDFSETGLFYNNGKGFEPIGTYEEPFTGTFDGNNHYIKGLYINIETTTKKLAVGLFGYTTGTISNLGISDGLVRAKTSASMAYVTVGAVAGDSKKGTDRCYNSCNVEAVATGPWSVALAGGVVGTTDGTITNCYNVGRVYSESYKSSSGESYAGGIVAKISGYVSETVIQSCLNVGTVSCEGTSTYRGAIAGYSYQGKAMWCYYKLYSMSPFGNSSAQSSYVHGLTEVQMATERSFDGLTEGWKLTTSFGHPILNGIEHIKTWNYSEFAGGVGTQDEPYLIETKEHLNNVRNYLDAHYKLISDIEFTDADFAEGGNFYNDGAGFEPIGENTSYVFSGSFDGNGYAIKNLHINISSSTTVYVGLFGYNTGVIRNLGIEDGNISGKTTWSTAYAYVGAIAGYNSGTIINCYNTGNISATSVDVNAYAGGIVGNVGNGWKSIAITNCYNTGDVSATSPQGGAYASGIVGCVGGSSVTITNCYNTGDASATSTQSGAYAGGIVGCVAGSVVTITNCYNTGDASATSDSISSSAAKAGGIAGHNRATITNCCNTGSVRANRTVSYAGGIAGTDMGSITNCYNIGSVSAAVTNNRACEARAGGIAGETYNTITNCYNIGDVSATATSYIYAYAGGIAGLSEADITNCYYYEGSQNGVGQSEDPCTKCTRQQLKMQQTFVGFDFENVWTMDGAEEYPFPELSAVPVPLAETLTSIAVTSVPTEILYNELFGNFSVDGGAELTLYYDDGTQETIDWYGDGISNYNPDIQGEQTLTITYEGVSTTLDFAVTTYHYITRCEATFEEPKVGKVIPEQVDFQIQTIPAGAENQYFFSGVWAVSDDGFNYRWPTASEVFEEGKYYALIYEGGGWRCWDENTEFLLNGQRWAFWEYWYEDGGIPITVSTHEGKAQRIFGPLQKQLISIAVTSVPAEILYNELFGNFSVDGGAKLTLYYDDGTQETIDWYGDGISNYNPDIQGEQTLTITYEGVSTTLDFAVTTYHYISRWEGTFEEPKIGKVIPDKVNFQVQTTPVGAENQYTWGDYVWVVSDDGINYRMPDADAVFEEGKYYALRLWQAGGWSCWDENTEFLLNGQSWDYFGYRFEGGGIPIVFVDSAGELFNERAVRVFGPLQKQLISIAVTKNPNKLTYLDGDAFDKTGMVVTAYYDDNTSAVVTDYTISGYSSTVGTKIITVSYGGKTATFTVTVNSRVPSNITSSTYTVSGDNISKIAAGTTVSSLLSGLEEGSYCKVYKENALVSADTAIGTGMVVKIMDGDTVKAAYTIIVTGDTNGDGAISVTDMIAIKSHILGKSQLDNEYFKAADTSGDNGISITDFIQVKAAILGKGNIIAR